MLLKLIVSLVLVFLLAALVYRFLPQLLGVLGLHPQRHFLPKAMAGHRALVITTSHGVLGDTGKKTGVFASEMTVPYYAFLDSGMRVDVASIQGGVVPIEPISVKWPLATPEDQRFLKDADFQAKLHHSVPVRDINPQHYDLFFLAGGWGAAYDLGQSAVLGEKLSAAYQAGKVLGGVCHGPLGLIQVKNTHGELAIAGKRLTAVTNKQLQELKVTLTPLHPETELRKRGVLYESMTRLRDIFASKVVQDDQFVTGQNQNDGAEVAHRMMSMVSGAPLTAVSPTSCTASS